MCLFVKLTASRETILTRTNINIWCGRSLYIMCYWSKALCLQLCLEKVLVDMGSGCYWEGIRRRKRKVVEEEEVVVLGRGGGGQEVKGRKDDAPVGRGRAWSVSARLASSTSHTHRPPERGVRLRNTYLPLGNSCGAAWDGILLSPACTRTPTHTHTV